jgi:hypothetical protein
MRHTLRRALVTSLPALALSGCLFSEGTGSTEVEPCAADERVEDGECVACEAGTTRPEGDDPDGPDTACSAPCGADAFVAGGECVACEAGSTNAPGDDPTGPDTKCDPVLCAQGEAVQLNACVACPEGTRNDAGDDASGPDTVCDPIACEADERVEDNACVRCAPGTRRPPGDLANGNDTRCEPITCQADERVRDNRCVPCAQGETNQAGDDASGGDTACDDLCPPDFRVADGACAPCAPGRENEGGDDPNGPDTQCEDTICGPNQYVLNNACEACPVGTQNEAGDDASGPNTVCGPLACGEDERVFMSQCIACAPGSTRPAGDLATDGDTFCDVTVCLEDEFVEDNACEPCAPGTINPAGDRATGADTACEDEICGPDEFVEANACVACAPGTTNPAGDNATGPATGCVPVLCGADERVSGNACVACPGGETNAPDDDASGADTLCDDACALSVGVRCDVFAEAYIKASNTDSLDEFGFSIDMDGGRLVVGAHRESSTSAGVNGDDSDNGRVAAGAAYVFVRDANGMWAQEAYLKPDPNPNQQLFGWSVSIAGDTIVVGAKRDTTPATGVNGTPSGPTIIGSGAAFVFERDPASGWQQTAFLKTSTLGGDDEFGHSVDTDGQTIVVGARHEANSDTGVDPVDDDALAPLSGAAYVFRRTPMGWSFDTYLKASNTGGSDRFGHVVSVDGDTIAVGAYLEDSDGVGVGGDQTNDLAEDSGAVYVFARDPNGAWSQQAFIKASNATANDQFGFSVDVQGDRMVVGAIGEDSGVVGDPSDNTSLSAGAVYVFERVGATWSEVAYLKHPDPSNGDFFGNGVALDGDRLVVGAHGDDASGAGLDPDPAVEFPLTGDPSQNTAGAAVVFDRDATGAWVQRAFIKPPHPTQGNRFGYSVAISGNLIAAGDYLEDSNSTGVGGDPSNTLAPDAGAVFVRRVAP